MDQLDEGRLSLDLPQYLEGKGLHFCLDPYCAGGQEYGEDRYIRQWNINGWHAIPQLEYCQEILIINIIEETLY